MKKLALSALVALLAACGGSSSSGNPTAPTLGTALIDRMGRPAINTAVSDPFELNGRTADASKDRYNANNDPTTWKTMFAADFAKTLAVLDSLDGTCGNQLIAKPLASGAVPADRYLGLAGVLADDRLYVRSDKTTCSLYLAVEADAVALTNGNNDCGGRTPLENTVDESYSLLAIGAPSGVTNGITADAEGGANATAFPFLGPPN